MERYERARSTGKRTSIARLPGLLYSGLFFLRYSFQVCSPCLSALANGRFRTRRTTYSCLYPSLCHGMMISCRRGRGGDCPNSNCFRTLQHNRRRHCTVRTRTRRHNHNHCNPPLRPSYRMTKNQRMLSRCLPSSTFSFSWGPLLAWDLHPLS